MILYGVFNVFVVSFKNKNGGVTTTFMFFSFFVFSFLISVFIDVCVLLYF